MHTGGRTRQTSGDRGFMKWTRPTSRRARGVPEPASRPNWPRRLESSGLAQFGVSNEDLKHRTELAAPAALTLEDHASEERQGEHARQEHSEGKPAALEQYLAERHDGQKRRVRPRVKPSVRGSWLREAMGQTFRHRAGAARKTNGTMGTNTPQKMSRPRGGSMMLAATMPSAHATPNQRMTVQTRGCTRSGICV